ncbi:Rad51 domain-containing protein [Mycena kentingensis (nom. inval.)]|nr:Rad51 domain-containing protein [Mycena kentingensis (nom. inval.)]
MDLETESLSTLLASVRAATALPFKSPFGNLAPDSFVAVSGPSGSGKSRLCRDLIASCLLNGKAAVLFDTDATFDVANFSEELADKHSRHLDLLRNLHIFSPILSTAQLAVSIRALPRYQTKKIRLEIGLVVVDSASSFYWPDRFANAPADSSLHNVFAALGQIRAAVIVTNWGLAFAETSGDDHPSYKQHLPVFPVLPEVGASHHAPSDPSMLPHLTHHVLLYASPTPASQENTTLTPIPSSHEVIGVVRKAGSQVATFVVEHPKQR